MFKCSNMFKQMFWPNKPLGAKIPKLLNILFVSFNLLYGINCLTIEFARLVLANN